MQRVIWISGFLCVLVAVGGELYHLSRWAYNLTLVGLLLLSLATVLDRLAHLDPLLKSSAPAGLDRIRKMAGDPDRLRHMARQATCAGCGRRAPRTDLRYHQALDAYYHPQCLAHDLGWSDRSRNPRDEQSIGATR